MAQLTGPLVAYPVDTEHRSTTAQLNPGVRGFDENGSEYTYVKAGGVIPAMGVCVQDAEQHEVKASSAAEQGIIGVATAAFKADEYGFIQTRGYVTALAVDATAAGSLLATGSVAGTLELAVASDLNSRGAVLVIADANSDTVGALVNLL